MFKSFGRLGTIVSVVVGYAIVYLFAGMLTIGWVEQSLRQGRSFTYRAITSTGELVRIRSDDPPGQYETLSGEIRQDFKGAQDMIFTSNVPWQLPLARFAWTDRLTCLLATENDKDAYWLVSDEPSWRPRFYITVTNLNTKQVIGYLGKNGFQKTPPQRSETLTGKAQLVFQRDWAGITPAEYGLRPVDASTLKGRTALMYVAEEGLVAIDVLRREAVAVPDFAMCREVSIKTGTAKPNEHSLTKYVAIESDRLVFDPLESSHIVRLPKKLQEKWFMLYSLADGNFVAWEYLDNQTRNSLTWFTEDGVITEEKQVESDLQLQSAGLPNPAWFAPIICPIPALLTTIALVPQLAPGLGQRSIRNGLHLGAFFCAGLSIALLEWSRRRVAGPRSWGWIALAVVFGPVAAVALLSTHCRNHALDLAPPLPTGAEVFA